MKAYKAKLAAMPPAKPEPKKLTKAEQKKAEKAELAGAKRTHKEKATKADTKKAAAAAKKAPAKGKAAAAKAAPAKKAPAKKAPAKKTPAKKAPAKAAAKPVVVETPAVEEAAPVSQVVMEEEAPVEVAANGHSQRATSPTKASQPAEVIEEVIENPEHESSDVAADQDEEMANGDTPAADEENGQAEEAEAYE